LDVGMSKIYLIGALVFVTLGYLTMGEWEYLFIPNAETNINVATNVVIYSYFST